MTDMKIVIEEWLNLSPYIDRPPQHFDLFCEEEWDQMAAYWNEIYDPKAEMYEFLPKSIIERFATTVRSSCSDIRVILNIEDKAAILESMGGTKDAIIESPGLISAIYGPGPAFEAIVEMVEWYNNSEELVGYS